MPPEYAAALEDCLTCSWLLMEQAAAHCERISAQLVASRTLEAAQLLATARQLREEVERQQKKVKDARPPAPPPPEPWCLCQRCGKQLLTSSTGNFEFKDGRWAGVCCACLRPEED